jgi:hypothetical protein
MRNIYLNLVIAGEVGSFACHCESLGGEAISCENFEIASSLRSSQ